MTYLGIRNNRLRGWMGVCIAQGHRLIACALLLAIAQGVHRAREFMGRMISTSTLALKVFLVTGICDSKEPRYKWKVDA